jgi:acyl CoA:acetate/3-ketoacid CoA transferase beta subunit
LFNSKNLLLINISSSYFFVCQTYLSLIIADLGVMDVTPEGLKLVELAPGVSREQIQAKTGVPLVKQASTLTDPSMIGLTKIL